MPSWSIHLAVAQKVNKKLKLNSDSFYYGNLIPDVDKYTKIKRYDTHYYNDNLSHPNCPKEKIIDINNFLKDYKNNLTNPLILGYYCHLLTDNFYNNIVYSNYWIQDKEHNIIGIKLKNNKIKTIDIEDKYRQKRKYKHHDFELYGKYLFNENNLPIPKDKEEILSNIKYLKNNFLFQELVEQRINYLNNKFKKDNKLSLKEKIIKNNYLMLSKKQLDSMLDECSNYIINELNRIVTKK